MLEAMITVAKLPFATVLKGWRWVRSLIQAPARLERLESQQAAAVDPRPVCTACGAGRVSAGERIGWGPNYKLWTKGACINAECAKEWRMTDNGQELHSPWQ